MHARLIESVTGATGSASVDESADRTSQRILGAAVADAIEAVDDPHDGVAEAFIAAVSFARLFFTYISAPPSDPDLGDDAELRRFAHGVLTPNLERAATQWGLVSRPCGIGRC